LVSNKRFVMPYAHDYSAWLQANGYSCPVVKAGNRLPRPAEILVVLGEIPHRALEVWGPYLFVSVQGWEGYWLTLEAPPQGSWADESWESDGFFTIKGGVESELGVGIALAGRCGQLVIYPDSGATAIIVDADDDASEVVRLLARAEAEPDDWFAFHRLRYG
jgi:hypothetical protein